ncbi:MarR family transcriptional regulator [soil metagenome]
MAADTPTAASARWLSESEQEAWRSFINGARRLMDRLERDLKTHGISHDDYGVLVALSESEGGRLRMAELADQSVESRSRLSHHIGRMESKGLVRRESCPGDRRGFFAVLTDEGRDLMEETAPHHVAGVRAHFLDHLEPGELAVIANAFGRMDEAYGSEGRCPGS